MMGVRRVGVVLVVLVASAAASGQAAPPPKRTIPRDLAIDVVLPVHLMSMVTTNPPLPELTAALVPFDLLDIDVGKDEERTLSNLVSRTPDSDAARKTEYYFRLGELYTKLQRNLLQNEQQASEYLAKAVHNYQALLENPLFHAYPKLDLALFYYGYTLQNGRRADEALAVYRKLLERYPGSAYAPRAHLGLGDLSLDASQYDDAELHYRAALKVPRSPPAWYATYKLGRIQLIKQEYSQALESFEAANAIRIDTRATNLNLAARQGIAVAYAEVGAADKAALALQRIDPRNATEMLEMLAQRYLERGEHAQAIRVYRDLMRRAASHQDLCAWQRNVVFAMSATGPSSDVVTEVEALVRLAISLKSKTSAACREAAAAMSADLAHRYHVEWLKTRDPQTAVFAEDLYRSHLDHFPDSDAASDLQYQLAALLWSVAGSRNAPWAWGRAALAFDAIATRGKADPQRLERSAHAAMNGWIHQYYDASLTNKPGVDIGYPSHVHTEPVEASEQAQRMLGALERFAPYIDDQNDDDVVALKLVCASTHYELNHYDEALPILLEVVEHHRQHPAAEIAAYLALDIYNTQRKYAPLLALVETLARDTAFLAGKADLASMLARLQRQGLRVTADEQEASAGNDITKLAACGAAYMAVYSQDPEAPRGDEVLYKGAVCFERAKSIGAAISAYGTLERYYPRSDFTARAAARIGKVYASIAYYDRAADRLVSYAKKYAGVQDASEAIQEAVRYRMGIGADDRALEEGRYFVDMFAGTRPAVAARVMFSLTAIYEKRDSAELVKHLRDYLRRFGDKGGVDRMVAAYTKIGEVLWRQSCPIPETAGLCVKLTGVRARHRRTQRADLTSLRQQCSAYPPTRLTVVKRNAKLRDEALAAFAMASTAYAQRLGKLANVESRHNYALGRLVKADREFETYLDAQPPTAPASDVPLLSRPLLSWLARKTESAKTMRARYNDVIAVRDAQTSVAASARIGQISHSLFDQLYGAATSSGLGDEPLGDEPLAARCDRIAELAQPVEQAAVDAYVACLAKANELSWFGDASKICERALGDLRPEDYPSATELRASALQVAPIMVIEPAP